MAKYNAKRVIVNGEAFDSKVEGDYYQRLLDLQYQWDVTMIRLHPRYVLQPSFESNGEHIRAIYYEADFEVTYSNGTVHIVDVKWLATETAKLKRKMFLYAHPSVCLDRIVRYGGVWVDYFDNEKRKRDNKKAKKALAFWK